MSKTTPPPQPPAEAAPERKGPSVRSFQPDYERVFSSFVGKLETLSTPEPRKPARAGKASRPRGKRP
jgi:hypothetical protein